MLIYILLRLFVPKKNYTLEGDECRHLGTANNFYKFWNRSFYDFHPPFYSWVIRCFKFIGDWKAGILTSLLCAVGLYIVCSQLYIDLGLTPYQRKVALIFLTFNYTLVYYSSRIFRYQMIAFLGTLMIWLMVTHQYFAAGLTWGLLGLTCTFVALRGFWIWGCLGFHIFTIIPFLFIFGSWIEEKLTIYCDHEYWPSGQEGKIERVRDFTIKQLISPMFFNWSYAYYGKKETSYDFKGWPKKIGGVFGLYQTNNKYLNVVLGSLTALAIWYAIKGALSSPVWLVILTLALLYPSLLKRFLPRNSIIAIPLLGFLLAKGLPQIPEIWLFWGVLALAFGFLGFMRATAFTKPKIKARLTARYLDSLPAPWGIMSDGIIGYYLAYRSKKRIVVIPHDPDPIKARHQMKLTMDKFLVKYAVFSDLYLTEMHLKYPAIHYIKNTKVYNGKEWVHKFKLLKTIKEDNDTYYVYELH